MIPGVGEEIKVGYRLKDSEHTSTAYVTKTSDTEAVGTNKHTDEPVTVRWTGTEWVQV